MKIVETILVFLCCLIVGAWLATQAGAGPSSRGDGFSSGRSYTAPSVRPSSPQRTAPSAPRQPTTSTPKKESPQVLRTERTTVVERPQSNSWFSSPLLWGIFGYWLGSQSTLPAQGTPKHEPTTQQKPEVTSPNELLDQR